MHTLRIPLLLFVRICCYCFAVDFVLRDPREKDEDKEEELLPHRAEYA